MPATLIAEAVYSRCVSAMKDERVKAQRKLKGPRPKISGDRAKFIPAIRDALYSSKIISYAQGYMLMRAAAAEYKWTLNNGGIALMWRGGCIIRSVFLGKIKEAFRQESEADQSAARRLLPRRDQALPERLARGRGDGGEERHSRCPRSAPRSRSTMVIARRTCPPTCCRRSAITSARTLTSGVDKPRSQFFHYQLDWARRGRPRRALTACKCWVRIHLFG
jgi:hypothetical protein